METTLFTGIPNLAPMTLDSTESDGLTYWKELIYVGKFKKKQQEIPVDENLLAYWQKTNATMLSNGVEIPLPIEHTTDPEKNRGKCIGMKVAPNSRSIPALFGKIKFRDKAAAELAKTANVSIKAEPNVQDGLGNTYEFPIVHVALTDYPVIPGLGKFEPIAASFIGANAMAIDPRKLAEKLGIPADTADTDLESAITTAIDELMKKVDKAGAGAGDNKGGAGAGDNKPAPAVAASYLALSRILAKSRAIEVDALVTDCRITPAVATDLKAAFCDAEKLSLSLSQTNGETTTDHFDITLSALKKQERYIPAREKSGPQLLELSNADIGNPEKNPLLRDAAARAKK